jgi:hypothetical protein
MAAKNLTSETEDETWEKVTTTTLAHTVEGMLLVLL